ncbi:MAG: hypothetical protein LQ347_003302 [Umbilicaria vellea]|nr:MAG: hypothetical protein LQ347_003302 [Umbilicaria vellea]
MPNKRRTRNRPKEEIEWIHNQKATNPSVQQRTLQAEFEKKFKKALPQASLSDILKKRHPKVPSVPGSSESTAHDTSREHVLQSSTDIDHAAAVGPDSVAALDETTRFGAQRKHPALQPMSCAAGLQDIQYQELQIQNQLDPTRSASMHCPHPDTSNTPSPPWVLGLDLQDSMYRDQNGSSYDANIMNPPLPSAESAGSLRDDHGNRLISSVEVQDFALPDPEWLDPPLPSAESAGSLRDDHGNRLISSVEVQDLALPDPELSDWFQNMCDQAEMPDNQPVDWNGIFNIFNPLAQDMASIPAQGDVSMESSAGQLPETRPLQSAQSPTQFPLKGLPGTSLKREFTQNPSLPGLSFKRHRVQEENTEDSGDILQSVDTLTSFFWTDEGMLEPPAEAEAKEALKTIVEDINKRYQTIGKKDVKLIRDIRNHLMKSTGFMVRKGRKASGICPNLNPPTDASEVALSGTKGKKGPKEVEGVYSETDNRSTTYGGTLVLTPTNGQHQFALSICLPPKISFRTIIPSTSTVFKVAAFGTLDELKDILESRTESWNVCDENGASLINVYI